MKLLRGPYRFWIGAYHVEIGLCALWDWSHFKIHRPSYRNRKDGFYRHIVWGRFSLIIDQPQIEMVTCCSYCDEPTQDVSAGDESWTHCENCQCIEPDTHQISEWELEQRG